MTTSEQQAVSVALEAMYLIRKGGYFYRPNAQGYTSEKAAAGRYTLAEAISYSHPNGANGPRDGIDYMLADPLADVGKPIAGVAEPFLDQLRRVNLARYEAWVEGADAGIMFDALELGGEVGELLNVVKKLEREERGWRGSRASPEDFADECADVLICLDKLARRKGVDLAAATIAKFNATSEKVDLPHRLADAGKPIDATQTREAEEEPRIAMFLEILSAMGGRSDASEGVYCWTNAFCETHEGREPDTFNRAIDAGYVAFSHDSDTDCSTISITPAGRAALNARDAA